jgi:hypothetical protein
MPETTTKAQKRRNIEKDASTYWLSHEARLKIRAVAKKRHLEAPALLEIIAEELAQKYLTPGEIAEIEQEAADIKAKRQQEQAG